MVPYINAQYAEHILKSIGVQDPNAKTSERDVDTLIKAAKACQELARSLETMETVPGYLVYTDKPVVEKKSAVPAGLEDKLPQLPTEIKVEEELPEHIAQLDQKFTDKLLKDFCPLLLTQFSSEKYLTYESYDRCVDEYFS